MNSFALLAEQTPRNIPAGEAAIIALIGFLLVVIVLAVLAGLLTLFKFAFSIKFKKKPKSEVAATGPAQNTLNSDEDEEVVAAIAAVIACLDGEPGAQAPFKIKSITKLK